MNIPAGVVINRDEIGDNGVETYCSAEKLPSYYAFHLTAKLLKGFQRENLVDIFPIFIIISTIDQPNRGDS
jgi:MinD superfamily P-loop ATPase